MLQFFRNMFETKWGTALALTFLGIIGVAFAITGTSFNGGVPSIIGGPKVATIGSESITNDQMEQKVTLWVDRFRKQQPSFSLKEFLARDGLNLLLGFLIDAKATRQWGEKHGIYLGDALIDHELARNGQILGPDGTIDPGLYQQFLNEQKMTDAQLRDETAEQLMDRLLLDQAKLGIAVPKSVARHYAAMLTEHRVGAIATLPLAAFAPQGQPNESEIQAYYNAHKRDYILPERRTIRWASYTDAQIGAIPAPTDAEVAARYEQNKAQYAPTDKRKLTQVVLPTEAAAKEVIAQTGAGQKLEQVVAAKGLSAAPLGSLTKDAFALQSSQQAADAAFAVEPGKLVGPVKTPLGWAVIRVDGREVSQGKTLEQARPELVKQLGDEKRKEALVAYAERIQGEIDNGTALGDIAKSLGLQVQETPLLLVDGSVYGKPDLKVAPQLAKIVPGAFQLEGPGNAQIGELETGKTFVIYDVGQLQQAAPPPLNDIRAQVAEDARLAKGEGAAKAAADKVKAEVEKGMPIDMAIASLGVALPPVDHVDKDRQEVEKAAQNAPKPLQLLFVMPKGKVMLLHAPGNRGWYVVMVTDVKPGDVKEDSDEFKGLIDTVKKAKVEEYSSELRAAFRDELGSSRDEDNLAKLRKQLVGGGS